MANSLKLQWRPTRAALALLLGCLPSAQAQTAAAKPQATATPTAGPSLEETEHFIAEILNSAAAPSASLYINAPLKETYGGTIYKYSILAVYSQENHQTSFNKCSLSYSNNGSEKIDYIFSDSVYPGRSRKYRKKLTDHGIDLNKIYPINYNFSIDMSTVSSISVHDFDYHPKNINPDGDPLTTDQSHFRGYILSLEVINSSYRKEYYNISFSEDKDNVERVAKAFAHAVVLCGGGKKGPF